MLENRSPFKTITVGLIAVVSLRIIVIHIAKFHPPKRKHLGLGLLKRRKLLILIRVFK